MALTTQGRSAHFHPTDLGAMARLATDAAAGIIDMVADIHAAFLPSKLLGPAAALPLLPYRAARGATRLVGGGAELTLGQMGELLGRREDTPPRRMALSVLNGLFGDYLHETNSPLALPMSLRLGGDALSPPKEKIVLLIHGLWMNDMTWERGRAPDTHDHGAALARDLGYSPVYLNYNSGLHISTNGRALADLLEALVDAWPCPVRELAIIGHSMGGLVARSACHYGEAAGHRWIEPLRSVVFLGTPHHGAPLERRGSWLNAMIDASPYLAPFNRLGKRRSAGITDLRYSNLVDEDWEGRDRFAPGPDERCHVPPPAGVRFFAAAAAVGSGADSAAARLLGDGLVPLDSALGQHPSPDRCLTFDEANSWVGYGMSHIDLLSRAEVYRQIVGWLR